MTEERVHVCMCVCVYSVLSSGIYRSPTKGPIVIADISKRKEEDIK